MSNEALVRKMIEEVEKIEKEVIVDKYSNTTAMKKDAVLRIYNKLLEVTKDED
jgi:hypothetical protein